MRSKVRLRRECEGVAVPGTAADRRSGEPGGTRSRPPPGGRLCRAEPRPPGAEGAGARRDLLAGRARERTGGAVRGRAEPLRSAVRRFQLPASRPPAPPAAARPPRAPLPSSVHGHGDAPRGCRPGCGSSCGTWRGDPAAGDTSGGSWALAARRAGCARRAHVPARSTGVCVCSGDGDTYIWGLIYI